MENKNTPITTTEEQVWTTPITTTEEQVWTYADTARVMAGIFPDFDWDSWKDEMKERDIS